MNKRIKVANAPCSWGILEFNMEGKAIGYNQVLREMAHAGYVGTELGDWGFMPTDPQQLKEELERYQLSMLAAFVPVKLSEPTMLDQGIRQAIQTARLLAEVSESPFIVLADENGTDPIRVQNAGRIQPTHQMREMQWKHFTRGAEKLALAVLNETNVKTVFHHHGAGFIETPAEVERFLESTSPLLVGLCFDTGHYAFGGGDPVEGFKKHRDRIWHVHFKDFDARKAMQAHQQQWDYFEAIRQGVFCELGRGSIDFAKLISELEESSYQGWVVVEQDVLPGMGTPLESAERNREYLRTLGL
jgi:inosose dehydratase